MSTCRNVVVFTSITLIALASAACGKAKGGDKASATGSASLTSASAPKGGRCMMDSAGSCTEYADSALGLAESACKDLMKGSYSKDSGCPTADLMGVCERKGGDKKFFYFGGSTPWVSDAKESCEKDGLEPGKWTAQPNAEQTAKDKALPIAAKIQGSCTKSGSCEDLYGEMFDVQKSMCEQFDGKFATAACSSDKLVGSCVKSGKVERLYEKDLKFQKMADLQKSCEQYAIPFGHWYPNPSYAPATATKAAPASVKAKGGASKAKQK